jgi:hypothetical protein
MSNFESIRNNPNIQLLLSFNDWNSLYYGDLNINEDTDNYEDNENNDNDDFYDEDEYNDMYDIGYNYYEHVDIEFHEYDDYMDYS